ncbi:MAG: histidine phosphatase family protein [Alphaproteobacteria bacterium]|nr:histidine phosphatase family protein [Alphaproteobacteria bacterium]
MSGQRYIFARHGESTANAGGWLAGHVDAPLTALGQAQALTLGEQLAEEPITRAYSSDLCRAADTARLALGDRPVPLQQHAWLRERRIGDWARVQRSELRADGRMRTLTRWDGRPPWGESQRDLAQRVIPWFWRLPAMEGATLVVAHGGVLRVLFGLLDGEDPQEIGFTGVANATPHHRTVSAEQWREALERALR